jgi:hypothetical protein
MKNSSRVNTTVAVAQKNESSRLLMRVALVTFAFVGVVAVLEIQIAAFLALTF